MYLPTKVHESREKIGARHFFMLYMNSFTANKVLTFNDIQPIIITSMKNLLSMWIMTITESTTLAYMLHSYNRMGSSCHLFNAESGP